MKKFLLTMFVTMALPAFAQTELKISQHVWSEFTIGERAILTSKYPQIELIPSDSIGIIHSVQAVNHSTPGTNSGAALGGALGQTLYIDNALKRSGSNYSATAQLGAALVGAAIGSSFDKESQARFIFNYGVRTLDGQLREVRVESVDEFTKPIGQCVSLPSITPVRASLCVVDKAEFLRKLDALLLAPPNTIISPEITGSNVHCRVPNVGLMTLEENTCNQMKGLIEK